MNLYLLSNDSELQQAFEQTGHFQVYIKSDLNEEKEADIIVISDREMKYNELTVNVDNKEEIRLKQIFYLLSNEYSKQMIENIYTIGKTKNITIIPPKLTISQIIDRITENVFPFLKESNHNIITFFGADSKVGTTMIAQSVAEMLAMKTSARVGLLFLGGSPSTSYIRAKQKGKMDDIKVKLINHILTADELLSICTVENENLYMLPGVDYILDVRHYHPEYIDYLINLATEKFNIIIIDAGSNIDSGMAITALNKTKNKYLVTTQQETAMKSFERTEMQILKKLQMESKDFMLVVNKFIKSNQIYTAKQISDLYNMTLSTFIPHLEFLGWQAEFDHRTLFHYMNPKFNSQINQLSKIVAAQANITYRDEIEKKHGILKKTLSSLGGFF